LGATAFHAGMIQWRGSDRAGEDREVNSSQRTMTEWRRLLGLAAERLSHDEAGEAERLLGPALADPAVPAPALTLAGVVAHRRGRPREAIERLQRAVTLAPGDAAARYNLAVVRHEVGEIEPAMEDLRRVLALEPAHVQAATNLAEWLLETDQPEAAETACRNVLNYLPDAPSPWLALGESLRRRGNHGAAERALRRAVALDAGSPAAHNRLGILLKSERRYEEALNCYRRALELVPGDARILNNKGLAALAAGRAEHALADFEAALETEPDFGEPRLNRCATLARLRRRVEAEEAIRDYLEDLPGSARGLAILAALLSSERDPDRLAEAERCVRRALAGRGDLAGAWDTLGVVLAKRGQMEASLDAGRRAVRLDPEHAGHAIHLADNLARAGKLDEAAEILQKALRHLPGDTELNRQLGIVLIRQGNYEHALSQLDARLSGHSQDQRAIAHRGVALQRLGRVAEAREYLGMDRFITAVRPQNLRPFPDLDAFNAALAADVRQHPTLQWEPVGLAASGGALTGELLSHPTEAIRVFERELRAAIDALMARLVAEPGHPFLGGIPSAYRLNTWATLVPEQGEISAHIHEESWLSGAYYVTLPEAMRAAEDQHAGWIEFGRPSAELPDVPDDAVRCIRPEEGLLLLFPSYLFHRTLPFSGEGERISLSFDVEPI